MSSPVQQAIETLRRYGALDAALAGLDPIELAALETVWRDGWARPEQLAPSGAWRSFGLLGGRGAGKTLSNVQIALAEIRAGRARRLCAVAQSADDAIGVLGNGPSGFIEQSPVWDRPDWYRDQLHFHNGATVEFYSAEAPGKLRGNQWDFALATEIAAWPKSSREETYANVILGLRHGLARLVWDTTPRRGVGVLRELIERAKEQPNVHVLRVSSSWANQINLASGVVAEWSRQFSGQRALEEIDGIFSDGDLGALFRTEDIAAARRDAPERFERCVIGIDPAVSTDRGSDLTGVVVAGYALGQVYVTADLSGRYAPSTWSALAIERYVADRCDCILAERNMGGDLVVAMLRTAAQQRGLQVVDVELAAQTRHVAGTINVKQFRSKTSKENRAEPVIALYEHHRVSHVRDADLDALEEELITWVPDAGMRSPNRIDALVFAVSELANLVGPMRPDADLARRQIAAITAARAKINGGAQLAPSPALGRFLASQARTRRF